MRGNNRSKYAQVNKECRNDLYKKAIVWAALGAIGPVGFFFCHNVLNTPQPISRTFTGYKKDFHPLGDYYETYSYEFASPGDHALNILGFILGIFAAVAVALLFYCLARFVADPIMYRIDLHTEADSKLQLWPKRIVVVIIVLLYCSCMVFSYMYEAYPEEQYIWLSDGHGNEIRVNKEEYEKYLSEADSDAEQKDQKEESDKESAITEETKESTTSESEDLRKTPVERGYPSNDLDYYIYHPDEPMPQELAEELMMPDSYSPGMDYDPEMYR